MGDAVKGSGPLDGVVSAMPGRGFLAERVFEGLSLAVVVYDRRLRVVMQNPASRGLFGDLGMVVDGLASTTAEGRYGDWATLLREVMESRRERRFDGVTYSRGTSGERLLDLVASPVTDEGSAVVGGMLVAEDVTARASVERRLAVSERLAAVGKLAAKVAHELNNPLDGMLRYVNLAMRVSREAGQDQITDYLNRARAGLMRMVDITRDLLEFSRSPSSDVRETELNSLLDEAIRTMEDRASASGVVVVSSYEAKVPGLRDSTTIFQVFCNLIKNAIDAMPDGGTLAVGTKLVDSRVVVTFDDTGVGLPQEIEKVFQPFFSTKAPGKGTGLGLAVCKDIVERYGGMIAASRRSGGGSRFTVELPLDSCARGVPSSRRKSPGMKEVGS